MRRAGFWAAVVLAAAALFVGSLYAYVAYRETSGPDGAVRGYLAALERGDAAGALGFGDVPAGPTGFLTDEVLAEQQAVAPMHDAQVDGVSESGDTAKVDVSYRLRFPSGDRRVTGVLHVVRGSNGWRLASAVVATRIHVQQADDRLNFAGTTAPDGRVLMFPGALPISFDTRFLRVDPTTDMVGFGTRRLQVRIEPTAAARKAMVARLRRSLRGCAHGSPTTCPLPSSSTVPGSLRGRIAAVRCRYEVTSESSGAVAIRGSAFFVGRYQTLTYDNVLQTHHGRLALPIDAIAYPVMPIAIRFSDAA